MKSSSATLVFTLAAAEEYGRQVVPGMLSLPPNGFFRLSDLSYSLLHRLESHELYVQTKISKSKVFLYPFSFGIARICVNCSGSGSLDRCFANVQTLKLPHQVKRPLLSWFTSSLWLEALKADAHAWHTSGHALFSLLQRLKADVYACIATYLLTEGLKEDGKVCRSQWFPCSQSTPHAKCFLTACSHIHVKHRRAN